MNNLKTLFLLSVLTAIMVAAGGAIGGRGGMTFALVMAFGMNFLAYWFSDRIVLKMYRAREVSEHEAQELHSMVRELTRKASIPMPKVYIIPGEQPNAFATGRNPSHAAVAFTEGIIKVLEREELRGVISHELAHIKHRDTLISTVAASIAGAISYLAYMAQWAMIFGGGDDDDGNPLVLLAMIIVAPLAALLVQMAISRSREFQADKGGAEIAGSRYAMANALKKLHQGSQQIPMKANPATSHMFIVNPLSGRGFSRLFSTHPPMEERIERLLQQG